MMKNIISSPYRKMKILLILPVFAIVLYAFAKPDYRYKNVEERVGNLPGEASLLQKSDNRSNNINLERDTVKHRITKGKTPPPQPTAPLPPQPPLPSAALPAPPPPPSAALPAPLPPPPLGIKFKGNGPPPLWVVDGIIVTQAEAENIDPNAIESIDVLKSTTDKYGVKGKDGVIEITTKKVALPGNGDKLENIEIIGYGSRDTAKKVALPGNEKKLKNIEIIGYGSRDTARVPSHRNVQFRKTDGNVASPLVVVDGVILNIDVDKIDPETIQSITVIKEGPAIDKYGEKAKGGVIEITTKKNAVAPVKDIPED